MILASNSLTTPAIGTLFWTVVIFTIFFVVLAKLAWKPILNMIKQREEMIKGSLASAEQARKEMVKLQSDNEAILRKAREERESILREAREVRDKMIAEAKGKASEEAEKIAEKARISIEREKAMALADIKEQVATCRDIASKLLREKLGHTGEQEKLIDNYLKDTDLKNN